jgi:hypothetical protein
MVTDLYVHPYGDAVGTTSGLASLRPALEKVAPIMAGALGEAPPSDSAGRLFLTTFDEQPPPASDSSPYLGGHSNYGITRYDPRTGTVGPVLASMLRFSPSRARVFVGDSSTGSLLDLQSSRDLTGVTVPVFVGEDFYYVAVTRTQPHGPPSNSVLTRIKPNAEPEPLLSSESISITAIEGGQTPLFLVQSPPTTALPGVFMLDPNTLAITPLASDLGRGNFLSASPSGRWLLFGKTTTPSNGADAPIQTLVFVDWAAGTRTEVAPALLGTTPWGTSSSGEWRPDRDEWWTQAGNGVVKIAEPGDLMTALPVDPGSSGAPLHRAGTDEYSMFTPDGQYWFLRGLDYDGPVYFASADDPTLAPIPINSLGVRVTAYWTIGDGRLLATAAGEDEGRQDLVLVDPAAGTSRLLAGGGQVVAVGQTRVLALLEWDGGRSSGKLTLIDLATGAQTVLAEDVYLATVDPGRSADVPPGTDVLATGTAIAFLSRGRFDSPYDGLWVTRLP